jgi:ankyrin repeat protein
MPAGKRDRKPDAVERFCRALWKGDHETLAALVDKVDPNGANRWNQRPLMMAVQFAGLPVVEQLVRRGAAVDQGRQHLTPITLAARRQAADIVRFLRAAGASESVVTAVYLGDRDRVRRELERDPAAHRYQA